VTAVFSLTVGITMARKHFSYAKDAPAVKAAGDKIQARPARPYSAVQPRFAVIDAFPEAGAHGFDTGTGHAGGATGYEPKGGFPARSIELTGTSIADSGLSRAFFLNSETGERDGFGIGDSVFGAGVLAKIEPHMAVIDTGEGLFALTLHRAAQPDGISDAAQEECDVYLLVQILSTYNSNEFGAVSKADEADRIFRNISGRVDGVEYETLFYSAADLAAHREIAELARDYGIELWATSWRLLERVRAFVSITPGYQAHRMLEDGTIIPAEIDGRPLFDVLNHEAVSDFLVEYEKRYLKPFRGLLHGYFFNEDVLVYLGNKKKGNNDRFEYWNNPTYSPAVLDAWREYSRRNNVTFNGRLVDRFPVHRQDMVANGGGVTGYFPGYKVPETVRPGQSFSELPRSEGVWKHWHEFIAGQFQEAWIDQIAASANGANADNPGWRGVIYFGLHHWSLPYERIEDESFTVPATHKWGAWGMQRGVGSTWREWPHHRT